MSISVNWPFKTLSPPTSRPHYSVKRNQLTKSKNIKSKFQCKNEKMYTYVDICAQFLIYLFRILIFPIRFRIFMQINPLKGGKEGNKNRRAKSFDSSVYKLAEKLNKFTNHFIITQNIFSYNVHIYNFIFVYRYYI